MDAEAFIWTIIAAAVLGYIIGRVDEKIRRGELS